MINSIRSIFSFASQVVGISRMFTPIPALALPIFRALQKDLIGLAREHDYLEIERLLEQESTKEGQRRLNGILRTLFEDQIRYLTEESIGSLGAGEKEFLIRQIARMEAAGDRTRSDLKNQLQQSMVVQ